MLLWPDLFGIQVHWLNMLMSVIILSAVGSDYNLLLVSRFRDEGHAGLKTGIIRSMAGRGGVVTSAGFVFAATMAAMMGSKLIILAPNGFHDRSQVIGGYADRAFAADAVDRDAVGPVVLVAANRLPRGDNHFRKPQPKRPPSDDPDTAKLPHRCRAHSRATT